MVGIADEKKIEKENISLDEYNKEYCEKSAKKKN